VRDASLQVDRGEIVGLVGESGSGKSLTALAALGLIPPPGRRVSGSIRFDGRELSGLSERELRPIRGRRIGLVFQEPSAALNPVLTIGAQIVEAIRAHHRMPRDQARRRALDLLARLALPDPARRLGEYPHQLSGGQRQRALVAIALAAGPDLLIADEPTTALDVTVQAQVLELFGELRRDLGLGILLITHDLAVVAETCDRVAVMYAGEIVEEGSVRELCGSARRRSAAGCLRVPARSRRRRDCLRGARSIPAARHGWSSARACRHRASSSARAAPRAASWPGRERSSRRHERGGSAARGARPAGRVPALLERPAPAGRRHRRRRRCRSRGRGGGDRGLGRRIGERQDHLGTGGSAAGGTGRRAGAARRRGSPASARGAAPAAPPAHPDGLPGPLGLAQSATADRRRVVRATARSPPGSAVRAARAGRAHAGGGRARAGRRGALSPRVLRRPAPADRDRAGAGDRPCWSRTSRSRRSTSRFAPRSSTSSPSSRPAAVWRCS
jgi:ABC-type dipeptide/oligopeptide/nickel transport system ATPase component